MVPGHRGCKSCAMDALRQIFIERRYGFLLFSGFYRLIVPGRDEHALLMLGLVSALSVAHVPPAAVRDDEVVRGIILDLHFLDDAGGGVLLELLDLVAALRLRGLALIDGR